MEPLSFMSTMKTDLTVRITRKARQYFNGNLRQKVMSPRVHDLGSSPEGWNVLVTLLWLGFIINISPKLKGFPKV